MIHRATSWSRMPDGERARNRPSSALTPERADMRQRVSKIAVGATVVLGLSSVAAHHVGASNVVADATKVCHSEPHSWSGNVALAPGESFATGVVIAQAPGVQSLVSYLAVSTGEGLAALMAVRVGDAPASNGAPVDGGTITVSNGGANAVHLTSVDLMVTVCHDVAVSDAPVLPTLAIRSSPASVGYIPLLPETGAASRGIAAGGLLLVGLGVGLVALARRRRFV